MNEQQKARISKFLSLILRHKPETIGLTLDEHGWAKVPDLLAKLSTQSDPLSVEELEEIVATNSKQRFAFSEDHSMIRANQGHSLDVALQLEAQEPPEHLYHGTVAKFVDQIKEEGLKKMSRQHMHLSASLATAEQVGSRRGKPVILTVSSGHMHRDGIVFYRSENGVWLVDAVPARYIEF